MSDQPLRIPLNETANFGPLKAMTKTNWEQNNPKLAQALKKNGTFEQVLESRVGQAILIRQQTANPLRPIAGCFLEWFLQANTVRAVSNIQWVCESVVLVVCVLAASKIAS